MAAANGNQPAGPAADAQGRSAIDPSENVKALTEAAVKRLDDLREMAQHCTDEMATLREANARDLREAEAKRIDAIRAVDVAAVQRAAEVSAAQAQTLATQVAVSAEALRSQVAATAAAFDAKLSTTIEPINIAISELRKNLYETQGGKQQVAEGRASNSAMYALIGLIVMILLSIGPLIAILGK